MTDPRSTIDARYPNRAIVLSNLGFQSYDEYLQGELWKSIKASILARDDDACRLCGKAAYTAHHIDYTKQAISGEDLDRLIAICRGCHRRIEFSKDGNKLLSSSQISRKTKLKNSLLPRRDRREKNRNMRVKCRCCGRAPSQPLARNDICIACHRKHGPLVHELAAQRST